ncbi:unnamed protein product [Linum trigynum]|uniref:Uncharacterized protein n=1 Tax=Linum trigynum TaxID=586398 RepID=A0AAV2F8N9_9ROSI
MKTDPRIRWIRGLRPAKFNEVVAAEPPPPPPVKSYPDDQDVGPSSAAPGGSYWASMEAHFDRIEARLDRERHGRHYSHFLLERLCSEADVDITQDFWHPYPPRDDDEEE